MKGLQLIEKTALGGAAALRRAGTARLGRRGLEAAAWGLGGFLLAAVGLLGGPLPGGACLVLWAPLPLAGPAALLGACGGYALFWGWEGAMEPIALALSCLAGALIFRRTPVSRGMLAASLCLAVGGLFLLDTGLRPLPLLRLGLGTALSAGAPRLLAGSRRLLTAPASEEENQPSRALPLGKGVERALLTMHGVLAREDPAVPPLRLAEVYDFAAAQVCRCCARQTLCWETQAEDTYRDLCAAGEAIVHRGTALREDFPRRFTDRCCHTGGFLTAVNQALEDLLARRREDYRRGESRRIAAGQYLAFQRLLATLDRVPAATGAAYAPELAVGSACRAGSELSGDRGATCKDRFGGFYVLLCDGMGSGPEARQESDRTARLLTAFLETGMEPDTVLALVNDFFVLRRQAAFATLDLLRVDLRTGAAALYKWGAAPSYLRREGAVEEIGTATPPPGLEAAQGRVPGQYELSLREGETLVMVSDGAYGGETARRLGEIREGTVRDLASCLITLGEGDAADDRTVVVLRLRPLSSAG